MNLYLVWLMYATMTAAWIAVDRWLESDHDAEFRRSLWNDLFSGEIGLALSAWRHCPEEPGAAERQR